MNQDLINNFIKHSILLIFLSFAVSSILIPLVKRIGTKFNFLNNINSREFNNKPVLRIGGLGIFIGYSIALILISVINYFNSFYLLPLFIGSLMMFLLGITDDLLQLSPYLRLVFQILIASYAISSGIVIENIDFSYFGINNFIVNLPGILSYFISILWLVGITNAINWIDGLDALASSITAISTIGFILVSIKFGNFESAFLGCALLGANLGFLRFNTKPASIYMGDGGSYLIGFTLATLSITSTLNSQQVFVPHLAIIILLIPILDMGIVIFKRIFSGKSPFLPDKSHIHHRLMAIGLSESKVVSFLCLINISLILLAFFSINN